MSNMFYNCFNLKELNLNDFNTSKVENMNRMFDGCRNLKTLKTTDKQLKKIYEEWMASHQNQVHSNINPKNLKISKEKEMQKDKGIDKEE